MTDAQAEFLVVRAGTRLVGLVVSHLVEVVETGQCRPVPSGTPALRGLMPVRGRLVPVVHLGAFLDGAPCPAVMAETGVIVVLGDRRVCLEVEAAEIVVREPTLAVPPDAALPWATAFARGSEGLVPLLDLAAVGARLLATGSQP